MVNTYGRHQLIFQELVTLAHQDKKRDLVQIGSLAAAHQYLLLYQLFQKYVPRDSKVLDWGTGIGHFSYFLCRSGYKAVGFSMEGYSFKSWLKSFSYTFVKGKTSEPVLLPFKKSSFDVVTSVGVLEHVHEFAGAEISSIKEIARILKPGGLFICYHLPNRFSLTEHLGKLFTKKFHHDYRFTTSDIVRITEDTNFKLIKIGRYGFLPRNSLGGLPPKLAFSKTLAYLWNTIDNILSFIFSPVCQNYFFVARKKD